MKRAARFYPGKKQGEAYCATFINMRVAFIAERDVNGRVMRTLNGVKAKVQVSRQSAHLFARM